jgi:hypothetical protein
MFLRYVDVIKSPKLFMDLKKKYSHFSEVLLDSPEMKRAAMVVSRSHNNFEDMYKLLYIQREIEQILSPQCSIDEKESRDTSWDTLESDKSLKTEPQVVSKSSSQSTVNTEEFPIRNSMEHVLFDINSFERRNTKIPPIVW